MACISLASGYIVKPAIPHILTKAFKNLAAVTFVADYSFKQADALKEAAKNAVVVAAPAAGAKGKAPAKEEVKEEKKEEEEVDMGGLFGEEY